MPPVWRHFLPLRRPDGAPEDDFGMELQAADVNLADLAGQCIIGAFAQLRPVLTDGGKGGPGFQTDGQVVDAHDAHILRHPDAGLLTAGHHVPGQQVVAANDGGAAMGQQTGKMGLHTLRNGEGMACQQMVVLQAVFPQGPKKGQIPFLIDVGAKTAADVADFPVTQIFQL